jgi:hypothetical protein
MYRIFKSSLSIINTMTEHIKPLQFVSKVLLSYLYYYFTCLRKYTTAEIRGQNSLSGEHCQDAYPTWIINIDPLR